MSLVSDSSSLSPESTRTVSWQAANAVPELGHSNAGGSGEEILTSVFGTNPDDSTESTGVGLRGGKATESDIITSTDGSVEITDSTPPTAPGKYSRKDLDTQDIFWTCSLEEFRAMSDKQWASFGTAFYVAPAGFDTATKHVVQLE